MTQPTFIELKERLKSLNIRYCKQNKAGVIAMLLEVKLSTSRISSKTKTSIICKDKNQKALNKKPETPSLVHIEPAISNSHIEPIRTYTPEQRERKRIYQKNKRANGQR
jgi:hypothetical protein